MRCQKHTLHGGGNAFRRGYALATVLSGAARQHRPPCRIEIVSTSNESNRGRGLPTGWTSCRTHMRRPLLLNTAHIRQLLSLQPLSPQTMGLDDLGPRKGAVSGAVHRLPAPVTRSSGSYRQDCTGLGESAACSRRGRCRKRSRACSHPPLTVRVRRAAETVELLPQTAWWQKSMPLNVL